jgi:hypothetical protein
MITFTEGVKNRHDIRAMWNAGCDDDEIIAAHGQSMFDQMKEKYGTRSVPLLDLYPCRNRSWDRPITDPVRRAHYGLDGPGKQLREIIAQVNNGR